jgi:UDP-glucose 4-epimerase
MLASSIAPSGAHCLLVDRQFNQRSTDLAASVPTVTRSQTDITDRAGLEVACRSFNPDHIFHFAASLDRTRDASAYDALWKANVGGTLNLLEALKHVSYKSFLFAGTSDVYGTTNPLPFREEQTPDPLTPYAITKLLAERELEGWSVFHGKPFTLCRIFLFLGPEMPPTTFAGQLMESLTNGTEFTMTKGEQKRDYLFLDDLLTSMMFLASTGAANREVINLSGGSAVSMSDLVEMFARYSGKTIQVKKTLPYRDQEIWEIRGSNEKLRSVFPDFNPVSLPEAINQLCNT